MAERDGEERTTRRDADRPEDRRHRAVGPGHPQGGQGHGVGRLRGDLAGEGLAEDHHRHQRRHRRERELRPALGPQAILDAAPHLVRDPEVELGARNDDAPLAVPGADRLGHRIDPVRAVRELDAEHHAVGRQVGTVLPIPRRREPKGRVVMALGLTARGEHVDGCTNDAHDLDTRRRSGRVHIGTGLEVGELGPGQRCDRDAIPHAHIERVSHLFVDDRLVGPILSRQDVRPP